MEKNRKRNEGEKRKGRKKFFLQHAKIHRIDVHPPSNFEKKTKEKKTKKKRKNMEKNKRRNGGGKRQGRKNSTFNMKTF